MSEEEAGELFYQMRERLRDIDQTSLGGLLFGFLHGERIRSSLLRFEDVEKATAKLQGGAFFGTKSYHKDMEKGRQLAELVDRWKA